MRTKPNHDRILKLSDSKKDRSTYVIGEKLQLESCLTARHKNEVLT